MDVDDWRLHGQESHLRGMRFQRAQYRAPSAAWDHDHCQLCNRKFSQRELGGDVAHAGWRSEDEYTWVCDECFGDFREALGFAVFEDASRRGVELHDAKVAAITECAGVLTIDLDAFVHDDRASDSCDGHRERVALDFHEATTELRASPGAVLSDGSVHLNEREYENVLPVPLRDAGEIRAVLVGANFELRLSARSVWMRLGPAPAD